MAQVSIDRTVYLGENEEEYKVSVTADVKKDHADLYHIGDWSVDIEKDGKALTGDDYDKVFEHIESEYAEAIDDDLIEAY